MANLKETNIWSDGIYQLELDDPVIGGAEGVDNLQAKQLANRTLWLKNQLAKLDGNNGSVTQILALLDAVYAGVSLDKGGAAFDPNWLMQALDKLIELHVAKENPHDQYVLKADVLKSFIGMAFPYGKAIPPAGWVSYDGTAINPVTSPILASIYGTHLPNLCGVVIRGWDKGRGLDPNRELLSYQGDAIRNIVGTFGEVFSVNEASSGAFSFTSAGKSTTIASANQRSILKFSAADAGVPTANENIMKNVAMHFVTPIG